MRNQVTGLMRWRVVFLLALVCVFAGAGCYTKLSHRPVEVDPSLVSTYRVDYSDDCSSCHRGISLYESTFGPTFYDNPSFYAWQWYYQVPWWVDAPPPKGEGAPTSTGPEARDFSRRQVAPLEQPYAPATAGGQSGMALPVSKVGGENSAPAVVPSPPDPRRDFTRREVGESGERQREARTEPPKESEQAKVKKQE